MKVFIPYTEELARKLATRAGGPVPFQRAYLRAHAPKQSPKPKLQ